MMQTPIILLALLCFLTLVIGGYGQNNLQSLNNDQKQILVDLWNHTQGPSWHFINPAMSWKISCHSGSCVADNDPCTSQWEGVVCAGSNMTALNLTNHGLSGSLPNSLGGLSLLSELILNQNGIGGQLSSTIVKGLKKLKVLNLAANLFSGPIPALTNLSSTLQSLSLAGNGFHGYVPRSVGSLLQLLHCDLSGNQLYGTIPTTYEKLTQLTYLDLSSNSISSSLPDKFYLISKLQYLSLRSNQLVGGISTSNFNNLKFLSVIDLSLNLFTSIDVKVFLPAQKSIQYVDLSNNRFQSPLPDLNCSKIQHLSLSQNSFIGSIPSSLGLRTGLTYLSIANTKLSGSIPDVLCNVPLVSLDLSENAGLYGRLPSCISSLVNLRFLNLSFTSISGPLLPEINALSSLVVLNMSHTLLTGRLPYLSLPNLKYFNLNNNVGLLGPIPYDFMSGLPSIDTFKLQNCSLRSALTFLEASLPSLRVLDLSYNHFTGSLPSAMFLYPSLETLILSSNCLSGEIPSSICQATKLQALVMNALPLSQTCVEYVFQQPSPFKFDAQLPRTYMTGSLPTCVYSLPLLAELHAAGNMLTGNLQPLPPSSNITSINLGNNILTGSIPASLLQFGIQRANGGVYNSLMLSSNRLKRGLSQLTLNFDNLSPVGTGAFGTMYDVTIELRYNRLSGLLPPTFLQVASLDLLEGNMFACSDGNGQVLPPQDKYEDNYGCGSRPVNLGMYYFLGSCGVGALMYLIASERLFKLGGGKLVKSFETITRWLNAASDRRMEEDAKAPHTFAYLRFISRLRFFSMQVGLSIGIILSVSYAVIKAVYSAKDFGMEELAYINQYAWTPSAAFFIGETAALLLLILWIITVGLVFYRLTVQMRSGTVAVSSGAGDGEEEKKETRSIGVLALADIDASPRATICQALLFFAIIFAIFTTNVGLVTLASWFYAALLTSQDNTTATKNAARAYMAGFYIVWNWWILPALLGWVRYAGPVDSIHKLSRFVFGSSLTFPCALLVFNNLIAPIISVLLTDQSCMKRLFFAADTRNLPFTYRGCASWASDGSCGSFATVNEISRYTPSFSYNYECSSKLLQAYVPVFFITAIYDAFLRTLFVVFLRWLCTKWYGYSFGGEDADDDVGKDEIPSTMRHASAPRRRRATASGDGTDKPRENSRLRWTLMFFIPKKLWSQEEEISHDAYGAEQQSVSCWKRCFTSCSKKAKVAKGGASASKKGKKRQASADQASLNKVETELKEVPSSEQHPTSQIQYVHGQLYLSKTIGILVVLGTFGTAAPLLAIALVFQLVLPLLLEEALLGRFLYEEIGRGHTAQVAEDTLVDAQIATSPLSVERSRRLSGAGLSPFSEPAGKFSANAAGGDAFNARSNSVHTHGSGAVYGAQHHSSLFNRPHDPRQRLVTLEQECKLSGIAEFLTGRWMVMLSSVIFLSGFLFDTSGNKIGWKKALVYPFCLLGIGLFLECNLAVCVRCNFLPKWFAPPPEVASAGEGGGNKDDLSADDGLISLAALGTAPKDTFRPVYEDGMEIGIDLGHIPRGTHNPMLYEAKRNRDSL